MQYDEHPLFRHSEVTSLSQTGFGTKLVVAFGPKLKQFRHQVEDLVVRVTQQEPTVVTGCVGLFESLTAVATSNQTT